ncbi:hypothetical protein IGS61_01455 [Janthinobacterium sp. FW305-129]|uniref:hypothetical protein n=1 Tax=Janthinobacterium sp. FW305-129 TaxID=2775054 RepID=UPI001E45BBFD|nr:hypothetical protein [Janthinobacterium sp. FW305-129]MCC7596133.1 hypothetical protein [Janthinobacterium sp. FW305-129]
MDVAQDDGTSNGRPAGERGEFHAITVNLPSFDPLDLKVDWKVLPTGLMYRILNLPYQTEQLANQIAGVFEYDYPPDYADFFWERQHGFAELGLEVDELVKQLRVHAGLPTPIPKKGEWNRGSLLREQRDKLVRVREEFESQQMANHQAISI